MFRADQQLLIRLTCGVNPVSYHVTDSFTGIGARIWYRYVDDTFVVINDEGKVQFFEHLNEVDDNIKFTEECSNNNKLAFLDCLIQREVDGSFSTSVYRKPTHTDHYLLFE